MSCSPPSASASDTDYTETCRVRKVKCDRLRFCSSCKLHNENCHYKNAKPAPFSDDEEDEVTSLKAEITRLRLLVSMLSRDRASDPPAASTPPFDVDAAASPQLASSTPSSAPPPPPLQFFDFSLQQEPFQDLSRIPPYPFLWQPFPSSTLPMPPFTSFAAPVDFGVPAGAGFPPILPQIHSPASSSNSLVLSEGSSSSAGSGGDDWSGSSLWRGLEDFA
ncbi:hypothetical protein RQP46_002657 [Phenoliferia psychrophenolica]